jgi:pilus assembly protein Flp/PilA
MRRLAHSLLDFLKDESGPTTVEYAILLTLIVAFCLPSVVNLGGKSVNTYTKVSNTLKGTGS